MLNEDCHGSKICDLWCLPTKHREIAQHLKTSVLTKNERHAVHFTGHQIPLINYDIFQKYLQLADSDQTCCQSFLADAEQVWLSFVESQLLWSRWKESSLYKLHVILKIPCTCLIWRLLHVHAHYSVSKHWLRCWSVFSFIACTMNKETIAKFKPKYLVFWIFPNLLKPFYIQISSQLKLLWLQRNPRVIALVVELVVALKANTLLLECFSLHGKKEKTKHCSSLFSMCTIYLQHWTANRNFELFWLYRLFRDVMITGIMEFTTRPNKLIVSLHNVTGSCPNHLKYLTWARQHTRHWHTVLTP